jgi:hypothetical protein
VKDYSAAQIKKGHKAFVEQFPKEGSRVREIFDILHLYKGHIIDFGKPPKRGEGWNKVDACMKYLRNRYGMDIIHVGKGNGKYKFVGEYISAKYVKYVSDKPLNIKVKVK